MAGTREASYGAAPLPLLSNAVNERAGRLLIGQLQPQMHFSGDVGEYSDPKCNLEEHYAYLESGLLYLDKVSDCDEIMSGDPEAGAEAAKRLFGNPAKSVTANVFAERLKSQNQATRCFYRAFGLDALSSSGAYNEYKVELAAKVDLNRFIDQYSGVMNKADRDQLIEDTRHRGKVFPDSKVVEPIGTIVEPLDEKKLPRGLTRHQRQITLKRATDAGYLPPTYGEINSTLALQDYLKNPKYPAKTVHQFLEIFKHFLWNDEPGAEIKRTEEEKVAMGRNAIRSVVILMEDYSLNSIDSIHYLNELQSDMEEEQPGPGVDLLSAFGADHPSLPYVVRHIDQSICLKTGSLPNAAFDCFSSTTVRLEPPDSPERRHKIVSDRYTTTNPKKFPEAYLARRYTELRVGIVGRQIGPAIVNQLIRDRFWAQRQAELERYPDAWKYAKESLELARAKRAEYGLDQVAA